MRFKSAISKRPSSHATGEQPAEQLSLVWSVLGLAKVESEAADYAQR
jgi:hypothetical protein